MEGKHISFWLDTTPAAKYPKLRWDIETDVAIIGGGIVGLLTAYFLADRGVSAVLLEADRLAENVTGHTTAKISYAHGLRYQKLSKNFNEEEVDLYARANQAAIENIGAIIKKIGGYADFTRMPAVIYATNEKERTKIEDEFKILKKLAFKVEIKENLGLPFKTYGGLIFPDQAIFHPRKFLLAVAKYISSEVPIYERSRVIEIQEKKDNCLVKTKEGSVRAKEVVLATNFPIYDKGLFFSRMIQRRSDVIGVRLDRQIPKGLYYSAEEDFHSFRPHPTSSPENFWLFGGQLHSPGDGSDTVKRYLDLTDWTRKNFKVKSVDYYWSTQDQETFDGAPYVGRQTKHTYVATGFAGWGMTNSLVAAQLISDLIVNIKNPLERIFNPKRTKINNAGERAQLIARVGEEFVKERIKKVKKIDDLKRGEGTIVEANGEKIAAYHDEKGKMHTLSPKCRHLGCYVKWNNAERSWDCPCHGSRYDIDGNILNDPTIKPLKKIKS